MKQLQKSDLKEGEIYKLKAHNREYLYRISDMRTSMTLCNDGYLIIDTNHFNKISNISQSHNFADAKYIETKQKYEFYNATPEEKHWLETCIKAYQFVSYEEAMKTFIPEYYEYTGEINLHNTEFIKGKTYKIVNKNNLEALHNFINEKGETNGWSGTNWKRFKPSTKEAYDAQFVVKEPEFVLPEIWWVRITKENLKDISKFLNANIGEYAIGLIAGMVKSYKTGKITKGYNSTPTTSYGSTFGNEITFDQFKQYVLKENTTIIEKPKVVLEEPKDKVLQRIDLPDKGITIVQVQCSEGGVYRIGDKIKVFDKYSPNKGKVFTIQRFRWTNDKSKICAVTELHASNGIGLDKIELYVEPKVKVKDDFVLPEKWCVKVNEELRNRFGYYEAYGYQHSIQINNTNKWSINIKEGFTEITFKQFKKYVLKDEQF